MSLNTVQEIERAIEALAPYELEELYAWLEQYGPLPIDIQIEADLAAGRLDDRIKRAIVDQEAGETQPL